MPASLFQQGPNEQYRDDLRGVKNSFQAISARQNAERVSGSRKDRGRRGGRIGGNRGAIAKGIFGIMKGVIGR
jgi:hypothetical protein